MRSRHQYSGFSNNYNLKGHKNWWEDICDPVPRSTMKLKFKTELRDDYKQEMVNAEQ